MNSFCSPKDEFDEKIRNRRKKLAKKVKNELKKLKNMIFVQNVQM